MRRLFVLVAIVIALALITINMPTVKAALANDDYAVDVYVNGKIIDFPDQKPFIRNGRTLVPIRFVSEALGCGVSWDNKTQTASIFQKEKRINIKIGSNQPQMENLDTGEVTISTLDVPAVLVKDRTMVPLRFVSENLGAAVDWKAPVNGSRGRVDVRVAVVDEGAPGGRVHIGTDGGSGGMSEGPRDETPWDFVQ